MIPVLIAALLVGLLVVLIVLPLRSCEEDAAGLEQSVATAACELHRIRRDLDVAQVRAEGRFETARLRRELRDELQAVDDDQRLAGDQGVRS